MIKELWESRTERRTVRGTEARRVFHCTWSEYVDGYGPDQDNVQTYLPDIQEPYPEKDDMYCVEISTRALSNGNCEVECLYSDTVDAIKSFRPNQLTSWDIEVTAATSQEQATSYTSTEGKAVNWEEFWVAHPPTDGTSENVPELTIRRSNVMLKITAYGNFIVMSKALKKVGKINSDQFLYWYTHQVQYKMKVPSKTASINYYTFEKTEVDNDINCWLLESVDFDRVNNITWRMTLNLLYSGEEYDWNHPHKVSADAKIYEATSFVELFAGMTETDPLEAKAGSR